MSLVICDSELTMFDRGRYRMYMPNQDFQNLTKITLNDKVGYTFSTNRPHCPCRIRARQVLAKQALSIRYLAAHCHSLRVLKLIPHLGKCGTKFNRRKRDHKSTATQATRPVILALEKLARECKTLEEIVIGLVAVLEDQAIALKNVPWYLREDIVAQEAEMIFKIRTSEIWM